MMRRAAICAGALLSCIPSLVCGQTKPRVVHVFVALADNQHQGIVPVPAALGNGDDPARNLYWGAAFGVRTYFRKSADWTEVALVKSPRSAILERSIFRDRRGRTLLVADAYRGSEIRQAVTDFFRAAAGTQEREPLYAGLVAGDTLTVPSDAALVAYVGHDGLMDFPLTMDFTGHRSANRSAIILACASRSFFKDLLTQSGATPLLWTTGLMAPEAYTLKAALDGWMDGDSTEEIRKRAAAAYSQYQRCSNAAALRLFSSDW